MEWHYMRTERSVKTMFRAAASRRGTRARRRVMLGNLAMGAAFALGLLLTLHPWSMTRAERAAAWIVLGLDLVVYAVVVACSVRCYVWRQLRLLKAQDMLENALGPQTVRLEGGRLALIGSQISGSGEFFCTAAELERAEAAFGGVLVVFRDGRAEFLPADAFSEAQPVPACVAAFQAAIAQARAAAAPGPRQAEEIPAQGSPAGAGAEPVQGFVPDGQGGGTLRFLLEPAQAAEICGQLNRRLLITPGYWLGQWRAYSVLLLFAMVILLVGGPPALLGYLALVLVVQLAAALLIAFAPKRPERLAPACGPQTLCLLPGGLHVERPSGRWDFRYEEFTQLVETESGLFFYKPRRNVMLPIPKTAFRSQQELEEFCELARAKLEQRFDPATDTL